MERKTLVYGMFMILIIITVGIAGCVTANNQRTCTMESKLCSDNVTYVGRDPENNCEFRPCPGEGAQIANPASVFCVEGGGIHRVITTAEGEAGYCEFPDGNVCEEWAFFRSNSTDCVPPPE